MTRPLTALTALLAVVAFAAPLQAKPRAYENNTLNFKNCNDENVTARWFKAQLTISKAGQSPDDPTDSIEIKDWDGNCVTIQWDFDAAHWVTKDGDDSKTGQVIAYVGWDDNLWAATRTYAGFFHARIAEKGDADPRANMKEAGEWLAKNNVNSVPAADVLAEKLASGDISND